MEAATFFNNSLVKGDGRGVAGLVVTRNKEGSEKATAP